MCAGMSLAWSSVNCRCTSVLLSSKGCSKGQQIAFMLIDLGRNYRHVDSVCYLYVAVSLQCFTRQQDHVFPISMVSGPSFLGPVK